MALNKAFPLHSDAERYLRGCFVAYDQGAWPESQSAAGKKRVIPFRFNPESLSRSFSIEQGSGGEGVDTATTASGSGSAEQSSGSTSGSVKQSFSLTLRFDLHDGLAGLKAADAVLSGSGNLGVLPELAALEDLVYAAESDTSAPSDGAEPTPTAESPPTLLFVWGRNRVFPVKITGMTVNETEYDRELNPVRAEVEVQLEVLGRLDAANNPLVSKVIDDTTSRRREWAKKYLERSELTNTYVPKI